MSGSRPRETVALMLESDGPGGAENVLLCLAEELRDRGYSVCPIGPAKGTGWLAARFRDRGFHPEVFHLRRAVDPACAYGLIRVIRRRHVDLLHGHEFTMAVYGAAAATIVGLPMLVTMHGGRSYQARWRRRASLRWAIRRSTASVAVSEDTREGLERSLRLPSGTVHVVPNGIRPTLGDPHPVRRELGLGEQERLIVNVANLYPVKGHVHLIQALAQLRGRRSDILWTLAIAGRGQQREVLEAETHALGIADRVRLLGLRDDVPNLLAAADVFVLPSLSEGLPLALLEAMFAGKAIVASSIGGIPEALAAGEEALLVPAAEEEPLARALERVLCDEPLRERLGAAARRRAEERFAAGAMADRYVALYENALGNKGRALLPDMRGP